ncbi:golgA4 [Acrasis kona]|uniref:GolgA4 n=1 Tax=Acrasis kona TaxID=1008807 RepID=A0AAW2Z284_9EUKA
MNNMEHRFKSKIDMLEKKSQYLKKMLEQSDRTKQTGEDSSEYVRDLQNQILSLLEDAGTRQDALSHVNLQVLSKEEEVRILNDKMSQMEDVMHKLMSANTSNPSPAPTPTLKSSTTLKNQKAKNLSVKIQPKKLSIKTKTDVVASCISPEQNLINEVFIDCCVSGAKPSSMTDREKCMRIMNKIRDLSQDCNKLREENFKLNEIVEGRDGKSQSNKEQLEYLKKFALKECSKGCKIRFQH